MVLTATREGHYDRLVFRFDEAYQEYDLRTVSDVAPVGINFVTLASGVCVSLTEAERLEAFSARMGSKTIREIDDSALGSDMRLTKIRGHVGFSRSAQLYSLSLT